MKEFADRTGQRWQLSLTIGAAMRLRDRLKIDILQIDQGDPPLLSRLGTDEILLGQVIACLLEPQFAARNVDESAVYEMFDGEAMTAAADAFWGELADFFRSRRQTHRAAAVAKQGALIAAAVRAATHKIDGIDIDKAVAGAISGVTPGSSE